MSRRVMKICCSILFVCSELVVQLSGYWLTTNLSYFIGWYKSWYWKFVVLKFPAAHTFLRSDTGDLRHRKSCYETTLT